MTTDTSDLRLVVVDMDGTLLDERGEVPDALWPLLDRLREREIVFAPASGRQYATLVRTFQRAGRDLTYIAENGSYVVRDGAEVDSVVLERDFVLDAIALLRELARDGHDLGVVLCGKRSAYVERSDEAFLAHVRPYYAALETVDDVLAVDDDVVKIAVFAFAGAERVATALARFRADHQVVVSGEHWTDLMAAHANKGVAVERLQRELGVTRAQTAAFGDYLNDLEMLDAADLSFAMANAHPDVLARARYVAPSHREQGVITTLTALLDDTLAFRST
ncbi:MULTISPECIES: Cof-type HAD-IIB family hydrolase [unclassified Nocardioides]|uniref:Cof-type HAD-IIB family hydrolase n=1 Tax=unclassified Nocardioides TaxID=2615069 RepID=UPI003015246C